MRMRPSVYTKKEKDMVLNLPVEVMDGWNNREGPVCFCTVDEDGTPNSIYATVVAIMKDGRIAVADNYFDKTKSNILRKSRMSALFITKDHKAYQVKGTVEYATQGPLFEEMLTWAQPKYPRTGVAVLNAISVYKGKEKLA
jgi:predicted pyridoxine 5'-phosphate oxidase superfamily flavin-nucleotide-binding protein